MHQVRVHLATVGSPIVGDTLYGGLPLAGHEGFFLHAEKLVVALGGETLTIEAPLPARFTAAIAACGL
jgi:23S rRNA pseudouridine1911/1915/1917 synthase